MTSKIPRSIRMIAQFGPDAFQKRTSDLGKYIGAKVSRRSAALLRKRSIIEGTYGDFNPLTGGWKPEWDNLKTVTSLRPHKGHKRERTREKRAEKITTAMQGMENREEKHRLEIEQKKPVKNFRFFYKRLEKTAKDSFERKMSRELRDDE